MKKITMICLSLIMLGITHTKAQAILDKMDKAASKADHAGQTADHTKNTGDKILGLFGKKKSDTSLEKTTIKITGSDFSTLKTINEKLQSAKGVESTEMKFNSSESSIVVMHTGSTSDILKNLQKAVPDVFAEKNIEGLDDGEISIKLK